MSRLRRRSRPEASRAGAARPLRLTPRGWTVAAVAAVTLVGGPVLGQRDILRVGVLLAVLLGVGAFAALRSRGSLTLESRPRPGVVEAGVPSRVRLSLRGTGRTTGARLLVEDTVPLTLGGTPRLPVPLLADGEVLDLEHTLRSDVRGSFEVGPAVLRARDVLGLTESNQVLGDPVVVDVLPRVQELPELMLGDLGGSRGSSASASATTSPDDASIREYRVGDDLRRVHWRSTARRGSVMVRSDEHPGRPDVLLLLDDRADGHRGRGAASSLEWAVSAAASAAVHLHRRGHHVRLLHGGVLEPVQQLDEASALRSLLRSLSRLTPGPADGLSRSVAALGRADSTLLVAVLGDVDVEDVRPLMSARPLGAPALALLLRTRQWEPGRRSPATADGGGPAGTTAAARRGGGVPAPGQDDAERGLQRAQLVLARAGWRTATASPGDAVPDVWGRLARVGARAPVAAPDVRDVLG